MIRGVRAETASVSLECMCPQHHMFHQLKCQVLRVLSIRVCFLNEGLAGATSALFPGYAGCAVPVTNLTFLDSHVEKSNTLKLPVSFVSLPEILHQHSYCQM